ncbi:hypothetical protein LZ683_08945 [Comamonas testosteroni]|uniref:hypothetical protein n=1 Tax=Comamonas testosteroni TaxID=285 RepID=UPI0023AA343A|nr:hypothetical protein [Comamonas testosteroni]WEE79468.1 hypothetical protein LZ683_08945 [Comamonas testosteroni]
MLAAKKVVWAELAGIGSAAAAKVWITALYNNLVACGLIQTADGGQLDPSTIASVPASGGYFGYWVFRFNDSMQSNKPVFIKFAPFIGSHGGANSGGVAVTVGTGTDGSGNITGASTGEMNYFNSTAGAQRVEATVSTPSYAIHGEGHFTLCAHANVRKNDYNTFCMSFLSITRTLDAQGKPTADGLIVRRPWTSYDNNSVIAPKNLICHKALLGVSVGNWNSLLTPWIGGQAAASAGGNTQIQRTYYLDPTIKPDQALVLYWNAAVTTGDEFEVAVDGIPRKYIALGNNITLVSDTSNARNVGFGILWDDL